MQELPPLNTLRTFDLVARHESISKAASGWAIHQFLIHDVMGC